MNTAFIYRMIIMVDKEIWDDVRTNKPTLFIKWNCHRTITCSGLQNRILFTKCPDDEINHVFRIAFSLVFWHCSNVFDLKYTVTFIGNDTLAFDTIVIEDKHSAAIDISINHIFLLIRQ